MMEELKGQSGGDKAYQRQAAARSNYPPGGGISRNRHYQSGTSTTVLLQKHGTLREEVSTGNGANGDTLSAWRCPPPRPPKAEGEIS